MNMTRRGFQRVLSTIANRSCAPGEILHASAITAEDRRIELTVFACHRTRDVRAKHENILAELRKRGFEQVGEIRFKCNERFSFSTLKLPEGFDFR